MRVPLFPILDGRCGCGAEGCKAVGKHPRPYATDDLPGAGQGIYTGGGLVVLDIDCKPGKPNGYDSLQAAGVELPDTFTVRTPTGGAHLYYSYNKELEIGNRAGVFPGVDVRGEGGFVVAAGSPHANGGTYTYLAGEVVPAPKWLLEASEKKQVTTEVPVPLEKADPKYEDHVRRCIEELRSFPPAVEGDCGGTQLFKAAQIPVRKYQLPLDVAEQLLLEVYNPRCEPPWAGPETNQIRYKVQQAAEKGVLPIGTHDWIKKLLKNEPKLTEKNEAHEYSFSPGELKSIPWTIGMSDNDVIELLHKTPAWAGVWRYDAFRRRSIAVNPPMSLDAESIGLTDRDITAVRCWFQCHGVVVKRKTEELDPNISSDWPTVWGEPVEDGFEQMVKSIKIGKEAMSSAVETACKKNTFHPVKQYLESVRGKGKGVLSEVASKGLGNSSPAATVFLTKTLVGAVRRILKPGCIMETVLTLYGGQGAGKTTFVRTLFGHEFVRSQMPDLQSKDASAALNGFWAVELAELDRVIRAETSTLKEFFSRTFDDYRPPYEKTEIHIPRQSVFIGTTNVKDFLRDPTGARRYWPVEVGEIDIKWLEENKDAIWAEALELCEAGEQHHLTPEEYDGLLSVQEDFNDEDPWQETVKDYCAGRETFKSIEAIYTTRLSGDLKNLSKKEWNRIRDCLLRLGCVYGNLREKGKQFKGWRVPQHMREADPSPMELSRRQLEKALHPLN